jgi:hypothetical protein
MNTSTRDLLIYQLQPGESAFVPVQAVWISHGDMFVNGDFPMRRRGGGTFTLRLLKTPEGRLYVDLSHCRETRFEQFCPFGANVRSIRVDELLATPEQNPHCRRLCDLKPGEKAWVDAATAWVHNRHMWLNGYAPISDRPSPQTAMGVSCDWETLAYTVDLQGCRDVLYPAGCFVGDNIFPIQVLSAS